MFITLTALCLIADGASSESEAKSMFVAYSTMDENCSSLLQQLAAVLKPHVPTLHETTPADAISTLSVYFIVVLM